MTPVPLLTGPLHTQASLAVELSAAGVQSGQTLIVHSSMKQIGGWICGGAEAVVNALLDVLGDEGTLVMPTHTSDNSDPSHWQNPPVPAEWWPIIREQTPAYDPQKSVTRMMGVIVETFRSYPGVLRSAHPTASFAAKGKHAAQIIQAHTLEVGLGEGSPLSHLYDLEAHILLLGVGYWNNTSLHLAEYRGDWHKRYEQQGSAMLIEGQRQWVTYANLDGPSDFGPLGEAYEATQPNAVQVGQVGAATTRYMAMRPLVDFATTWISKNYPKT